jgi:hypothetical protein
MVSHDRLDYQHDLSLSPGRQLMKRALLLTAIFLMPGMSFAADRRYSSSDVQVNGYYRSNGTYVQPHYRSSPNAYKWDNYDYKPSQPQNNSGYSGSNYNANPGRYNDNNPHNDSPSYQELHRRVYGQ